MSPVPPLYSSKTGLFVKRGSWSSHRAGAGAGRPLTMRVNKHQRPSDAGRCVCSFSGPVSSVHSLLALWTFTESDLKCGLVPPPTPLLSMALHRPDPIQLNSNWISGFLLAAKSNCN